MKQVLQHRKQGDVRVHDVPPPQLRPGGILVRSRASLISAGTEKAGIELTRQSLVGMAQERPDLVRRVLDKVQKDGVLATWNAVRDQLDRHVPLGYSCAGTVAARSAEVTELEVGQLVACAGAGHACHAEVNFVPRLLAAAVPDGVSAEQAAYATVGSIALQGIRNANVQLGESVAVIGLGLIGQLAVQILKSAGCRVLGFDVSEARASLAMEHGALAAFGVLGAKEAGEAGRLTRGRGVDAVLICAATKSNDPIEFAAKISRDRGKVVMVGVTGMDVPRNDYYHKELSLIVSRSYGPGRYDASYEERGNDYPAGYVRWTEQRNLEAFLDLVAAGSVRPELFTTHRFPIADAEKAYELILGGSEPYLGVILDYPAAAPGLESTAATNGESNSTTRIALAGTRPETAGGRATGVSFVGVGNFARGTLLPHLRALPGLRHEGLLSASGHSAATTGEKFGFRYCTSRLEDLLDDGATDAVFIATRHSQHAELASQALRAGKAVFVEKPLAVNGDQLRSLVRTTVETGGRVMAGFNRRFAPLARTLKEHLVGAGPLTMHYRVNAGPLPHDHWLAAPDEGGRIIGEGCHFLDFFAFLCGARPRSVFATPAGGEGADDLDLVVSYEDGSVGHLSYCTTGASATPKERVEIFGGGRSGLLDDFRRLELHRGPRRSVRGGRWSRQDKGHRAELQAFIEAVRTGGPTPIPWESQIDTTLTTFAALRSAAEGRPVPLDELRGEL